MGGEILGSPFILIGSVDGLVEELRQRRERLGTDYCGVFEKDMEALAPIVE